MKILYVGDVMGDAGLEVVEKVLPKFRREHKVDFVVAQAENLSDGKGVRVKDFKRLLAVGVDFCTGGNHTMFRDEIFGQLNDPNVPIVRPANYPADTPGLGYKYAQTSKGKILVVSLLGQVVGKDADVYMENPLRVIDQILAAQADVPHVATVVNLHGDFSSEKRIIGYYLDGRATMVVGDHWHIPTADADVLPRGTAHITDVGMCGSLDSSLGVKFDSLITRWRDGKQTRNMLETFGRMQFNGLLVESNIEIGLGSSPQLIHLVF
jgi:2',3'-cyclic-nucleotide 2'-phosphodiesterase